MSAPNPKRQIDWEAVEREYRSGVVSNRAIANTYGVSETAIRKRAKIEGWVRSLALQVKSRVEEKLVRTDGSQPSSQAPRATDEQIVEAASVIRQAVVLSHRKDIAQLRSIATIIAGRLAQSLDGIEPDGPCLGSKESAGDLLEKLTRTRARLIPLERQAYNLDAERLGDEGVVPAETEPRRRAALALLLARQ